MTSLVVLSFSNDCWVLMPFHVFAIHFFGIYSDLLPISWQLRFFLLFSLESLYILDTSLYQIMWLIIIFFLVFGLAFIPLVVFENKLLPLMSPIYKVFSFMDCGFGCLSNNISLNLKSKIFFSSFTSFIIGGFIFSLE